VRLPRLLEVCYRIQVYTYLDENNGNLNIVTQGKDQRSAKLNFFNNSEDFFIKTTRSEFDGTYNGLEAVFFSINAGERFVNSEEYFSELYEPFLVKKIFKGFSFSDKSSLYKYLPERATEDAILKRKIIVKAGPRSTIYCFNDQELFNRTIQRSHFDSIATETKKREPECTNAIEIEDTLLQERVEHTPENNTTRFKTDLQQPDLTFISVAIDNYPWSSGLPSLKSCNSSGEKLQSFFNEHNDGRMHISLLKDSQAIRTTIIDTLHLLSQKINQTMIVYLLGHGMQSNYGSFFYFFPFDGSVAKKRVQSLSTMDISEIIKSARCKNLIFMIDACYSAAMIECLEKIASYKAISENCSITLLLSSTEDIESYQNNSGTAFSIKLLNTFKKCTANKASITKISDLKTAATTLTSDNKSGTIVMLHYGPNAQLFSN
jgi:hypothetical protein